MKISRTARFVLLPLLAALLSLALTAGLLIASPAPLTHSRIGQALALRASLRPLVPSSARAKTFQDFGVPQTTRRGSDGRYIYRNPAAARMHSGAIGRSPHVAGAAQVDEAVQTFDAFSPPPAFAPGQSLTPTNLTPIWTADQTMLVFSSNRTATGTAGTRFHIWAVPISGGTAVQLTNSTAAAGESAALPHGEFFPALSAGNNTTLAFTSDANSANVQNLFSVPFAATTVAVSSLTSPTVRGSDAAGNSLTGFGSVGRVAFSPSDANEVVFSAVSTTGTYAGHSHLYFLYLGSGGYDESNPSLPAKITDGPADDTDPAYSADGVAIAFASTANTLRATGSSPSPDANTALIATGTPGANRSIFVVGGGGALGFATVLNGGNAVTMAGTDNFAPAWSFNTRNTFLNPTLGQQFLAFSRGASAASNHDIYTFLALKSNAAGSPQLFAEGSTVLPAVASPPAAAPIPAFIDTVVQLNTDDAGNAYDDIYPTWSPSGTFSSIAYSSNRTVTYSDPTAATASETAISIPRGGSLGGGLTVGTAYAGLLESQVLNLDPPTLLPYSGNEIIHVANSAGQVSRANLTPGQAVTLTVRLSDREAGINDANVYVQIKDPDSKYQDAQGFEHKVFAKDFAYRTQANAPALLDSGSSTLLMNGGGYQYQAFNQFPNPGGGIPFNLYNRGSSAGIEGPEAFLSGTALASDTAAMSNNPVGNISIGRSGGGTNPETVLSMTGMAITDSATTPATPVTHPPGSDPNLFIPWGPEFECQVVNPQYDAGGAADTIQTDYRDPYYLAGVDDQQPFSGTAATPRPTADGMGASGSATPAEWLKLTRLASDGQGGNLYSVNWTTPASGSDFYLDFIAFDKASAPPIYTATQARSGVATGTPGTATGSNWRIYDNIGGFSTASSIGNNDILVVSDYALGQKFAATTFGGATGFSNLIPKLYGAESYVTDVDVNILPNAIYRHYLIPGADPNDDNPYNNPAIFGDVTGAGPHGPNTEVLDLGSGYDPGGALVFTSPPLTPYLNGLGVGSYNDTFINDGTTVTDTTTQAVYPNVQSQRYSIWRVLSRGPVPASVYAAYEPKTVTQPAVNDSNTKVVAAAGSALDASRCIVWLSPFTGDVVAGAGTLIDSTTQANLRSFVRAGGRLCVTGQDVASSLTQNGTSGNTTGGFLPDVLNAAWATSSGGTHLPANGPVTTDNRLTFSPSYDENLIGTFQELTAGNLIIPVALDQRLIRLSNNFGGNLAELAYVTDLRNLGNWRTDGSLDQLGPYPQSFSAAGVTNSSSVVGQIDTVIPGPGAHVDQVLAPFVNQIPTVQGIDVNAANAPGGAGLIYSETPLTAAGGGSKVVYATFGLEALSAEFYRQTSTLKPNEDTYEVRNVRQGIIHNIVSYLRSGTITGTIRSTSGNGSVGAGISGATVYLQSGLGPAIPGRGTFSATTDGSGNFRIVGIEPGSYTLAAYRTGFINTTSNKGVLFVVEGDTTQTANLTLAAANPGTVTGTVTDNSTPANPVPGAAVVFTSTDGQTFRTTTNANGVYTLTLPPATYIGTASKAGFGVATSASTAITTGVTSTVNFALTPGPGTASGRVVDTNAVPISGATVFFSGNGLATPVTATTGSDGTYTVPNLAPGTYSVAASATGYATSAPIQVTIASSANTVVPDIALGVAVNGTLGGLVTASNSSAGLSGVTLTIVNSANQQTVTTVSAASSTPAAGPTGDGSPLNYSISLLQGTYTITASQSGVTTASQSVTVPANGFVRADFTGTSGIAPLHTFSAGIQFVSTPYDYSALGFDGLFGALNTAPGVGNRSHVAVWNPLVGAYALDPNAPADALRPGIGYWVNLRNPTPVTQVGTTVTGSVQVALNPSWNQIGVPTTAGVLVSSLTFAGSDGVAHSFADASSSSYHLVSPTLFSYNGSSYQSVGAGATLQPWQAYWIQVYTPVTMSIPTGK